MLALLGLMQNSWHIQGTASPLQRRLRSSNSPLLTSSLVEEPSKGATIVAASDTSRCLHLKPKPRKGDQLWIGDCSEGKMQATRFQIPEGNRGLIKPAENSSLCLDDPGGGHLQLWSCDAVSSHLELTVHSEPSGWIGVPHFDIADRYDAVNMDASDLKAVTKRAEELGCAGFSVFNGRAFLKKVHHLTLNDLNFMGHDDPNIFYLRRNQSGDVSIRLAANPNICMLAPTKPGEVVVSMAPCKGPQSATEGAWTAGMLFRVEGDMKPSSEKVPVFVKAGLENTAKPVLEGVATPSTTSTLVVDTDMDSDATGKSSAPKHDIGFLAGGSLGLLGILGAVVVIMARGKSARNVEVPPRTTEPKEAEEELGTNPDLRSQGEEDDPADEAAGGSSTENDGLLETQNRNEELAVLTEEEPEEKQDEVAGGGEEEAKEKEAPTGGNNPFMAAQASTNSDEDPELKATPAGPAQEAQSENKDLNNPFADETSSSSKEVPAGMYSGW